MGLIKAFQDKFGEVPGIGRKKNPKKMHITLGCMNITEDEVEEAEMKFKRIGEKFTDMTSPGSFLLNMHRLEMGDGSGVLLVKVQLGKEILEILRGLIEDELGDKLTDLRFSPHITIYGDCSITPEMHDSLFKTAEAIVGPTISVSSMSLRERLQQKVLANVRVVTYAF